MPRRVMGVLLSLQAFRNLLTGDVSSTSAIAVVSPHSLTDTSRACNG